MPRRPGHSDHVSARLDAETMARLDALAARRGLTRSSVVRLLVAAGLPIVEAAEVVRPRRLRAGEPAE